MPKPKDIIALVTIIGILLLKFHKVDSGLDAAAALIIGYYFAKRSNGSDNGR